MDCSGWRRESTRSLSLVLSNAGLQKRKLLLIKKASLGTHYDLSTLVPEAPLPTGMEVESPHPPLTARAAKVTVKSIKLLLVNGTEHFLSFSSQPPAIVIIKLADRAHQFYLGPPIVRLNHINIF